MNQFLLITNNGTGRKKISSLSFVLYNKQSGDSPSDRMSIDDNMSDFALIDDNLTDKALINN